MWGKRSTAVLGAIVLLGMGFPDRQTTAADYTWSGDTSYFDDSNAWTPAGLPGALDNALFTFAGDYDVWWSDSTGDRTNTSWTVQNGHVTMRKVTGSTHTYTATSDAYINSDGSLTLGAVGLPLNLAIGGNFYIDTGAFEIIEGTASDTYGYIGNNAGNSGTATVDGAGSTWTNVSELTVGKSGGTGMLTIQNGGVVSDTTGWIALGFGSSGTATVDGMGSTWTNTERLNVGAYGPGTLSIQNGGAVSNTIGGLGVQIGSSGTTTVDGTGSTWTNTSFLSIGGSGAGTLIIQNGGAVSDTFGALGWSSDGSGTVTVDGAGSTWTNTDALYVGGRVNDAGGSGMLTVGTGALVEVATTLMIWGPGTVNLNGGTLTANALSREGTLNFNAGTLNIGSDLSATSLGTNTTLSGLKTLNVGGTTTLDGYSTLTLDGGTFSTGDLIDNGGFAFNRGTFNLTGDDLTIGTSGLFGGMNTL